eukprot:m.82204 g.82204  ORF g.82204 m.82204 type:complete len:491 (+) comp12678_c1_seq1:199-1671(+)
MAEFATQRQENLGRLRSCFDAIIAKYSKPQKCVDVLDLENECVVEDYGVLQSIPDGQYGTLGLCGLNQQHRQHLERKLRRRHQQHRHHRGALTLPRDVESGVEDEIEDESDGEIEKSLYRAHTHTLPIANDILTDSSDEEGDPVDDPDMEEQKQEQPKKSSMVVASSQHSQHGQHGLQQHSVPLTPPRSQSAKRSATLHVAASARIHETPTKRPLIAPRATKRHLVMNEMDRILGLQPSPSTSTAYSGDRPQVARVLDTCFDDTHDDILDEDDCDNPTMLRESCEARKHNNTRMGESSHNAHRLVGMQAPSTAQSPSRQRQLSPSALRKLDEFLGCGSPSSCSTTSTAAEQTMERSTPFEDTVAWYDVDATDDEVRTMHSDDGDCHKIPQHTSCPSTSLPNPFDAPRCNSTSVHALTPRRRSTTSCSVASAHQTPCLLAYPGSQSTPSQCHRVAEDSQYESSDGDTQPSGADGHCSELCTKTFCFQCGQC